jgi:hypothetical protein
MKTTIATTDLGATNTMITNQVHGLIVPPNDVNALARDRPHAVRPGQDRSTSVSRSDGAVEGELSFNHRMQCVESIWRRSRAGGMKRGRRLSITTCSRFLIPRRVISNIDEQ